MEHINEAENEARMVRGELYHAFVPNLIAKRNRCPGKLPEENLLSYGENDKSPIPAAGASEEEDAILLQDEAYIDGPIKVDYGTNLRIGKAVYVNFNCTFLDTCIITIGARTLIGPNCSFYSATHPLDPFLRNGIQGPELGAPIMIGEDCWLGGGVIVCPGVTIGRGCTVGAGSVVTKDVPEFTCVAGNPARFIRKIEPKEPDPNLSTTK
ncbi:acetyltransferase [Hyphodiscus hymeniophilus]|uniref:Acetyltransferase n=1 Tax=Hyphodiscus hymeniophilus TaxID=353542 RepID=A0A9P6VGL8_9HELO|nr:acetyltransferase [Hyphodiscus hymeniophilus]